MRPLRFLGMYFIAIGIVKLVISVVMLIREDKRE